MTGRRAVRPRRAAAAALAVLAVLAVPCGVAAQIPSPGVLTDPDPEGPRVRIAVSFPATRADQTIEGRVLLRGADEIYLASADAAGLFQGRRSWQEEQRRLTLRAGDRSFRLTAGSRLVSDERGEMLLRLPLLAFAGDIWLPMEFLTRVLGPATRQSVTWDARAATLTVGSAHLNVLGMRIEELARATAVRIQLSEPLTFRADGSQAGLISLKIYGGEGDLARLALDRRVGLVERIEATQHLGHVLLLIRVSDLVSRYRTHAADNGREVVVLVEEEQSGLLPEPSPRGRVSVALEESVREARRVFEVRTVVIDPGHGGAETGKVGRSGLMEKDVNLAVARELKRYLERQSGVRVVLTREDDREVPLGGRAEIANRAGGDLFVSLHCNGWFTEKASGVETYFLSPAKTERDRTVARLENEGWSGAADAATAAVEDDISFILWDLVQNRYINESSDLAELIQDALCLATGSENRGVKQSGFRVLVGAHMPAVLVEMGFLSHRSEERLLGDPAHQRKLAAALGEAILAFRQRHARGAGAGEVGR